MLYDQQILDLLDKRAACLADASRAMQASIPTADDFQFCDELLAVVAEIDVYITRFRWLAWQDEQSKKPIIKIRPARQKPKESYLRVMHSDMPSGRIDCSLAPYDPPWIWAWNGGEAFVTFSDMDEIPTFANGWHR